MSLYSENIGLARQVGFGRAYAWSDCGSYDDYGYIPRNRTNYSRIYKIKHRDKKNTRRKQLEAAFQKKEAQNDSLCSFRPA